MTNPKDLVGAKKAPLEGVPAAGAIFAAPAHAIGHAKYGQFNWRLQPVQVMSYIGAIKRHIAAYEDGQDLAEDTQVHHLAHALAGLNIIADSMALGTLIDNRPPKGPASDMLRAQDRSAKPTVGPVTLKVAKAIEHLATAPFLERFTVAEEPWGAGDGDVIDPFAAYYASEQDLGGEG